mgnify:CR=1 FL=1|eukprot:8106325-Pyramimonas_sp.AAC.2
MNAVKQFFMLDGLMGGLSRYNRVHVQGETMGPVKHIMWGVFILGTGLEVGCANLGSSAPHAHMRLWIYIDGSLH